MGATGTRAVPGLALPAGLPSPSAGCGPAGGGTLPRQPGTPKGVKDDMLDETFIDVITPWPSPLPLPSHAASAYRKPTTVAHVVPDSTATLRLH